MRHRNIIGRAARHAAAALALACAAQAAAAQDANTNYRPAPHDPFVKPRAIPKKKPEDKKKPKNVPVLVAPPSVKARIEAYKEQRARAMEAQLPVPKPTTALTLGETQITGIFRTPRGYAAMVLATPIKLSYVIYPGERFYDAQLVAIEEGRLVFRRERQWSDGRRETMVETKPLRKVAAGDQLAAAAEKLKDDKPAKPARDGQPAADAPKPEKPGGND
ncbi:MAG TPA: hypothetical protein VIP46_22990 [Pyrinomonadaceae bacterium]